MAGIVARRRRRFEAAQLPANSSVPGESRDIVAPMHETRLQTRWTDFDALGHVTHAAYPVYLDEARDDFLTKTVGPFDQFAWVIVHVSIDYRREIRHPADHVLVRTRVEETGRTSVTFRHEVVAPDGELAAESKAVLVAWDAAARRPRELSAAEREKLRE
jgi:acyl-CoA thioester hydrolase